MLSLYITDVYNYLILSRQMRSVERGLYMPTDPFKSLIRVHGIGAINSGSNFIKPTITTQNLSLQLDMTKMLKGNLGVQVVWQPFDIPEPEDANKMFVDIVEAGLCFIPVVGPLAFNCFGLFVHIVNNPEAFKEANLFELSGYLLGDAAAAAEPIADGLPKHSKAGKIAGFLGKIGGALTKMSKLESTTESEVKGGESGSNGNGSSNLGSRSKSKLEINVDDADPKGTNSKPKPTSTSENKFDERDCVFDLETVPGTEESD